MPEPLEPRLNEVAAALAALTPRPPALDRDRLLFRAGRASAPKPWMWRLTAAASTTLAAVLGVLLVIRTAAIPLPEIIYVRVEPAPAPPVPAAPSIPIEAAPPAPPDSWPSTAYTRMEDQVLRWGLDGLAEPAPPPAAPVETVDSLLKSL